MILILFKTIIVFVSNNLFQTLVLYDPENVLKADELKQKLKQHPKYGKWIQQLGQNEMPEDTGMEYLKYAILIQNHIFFHWCPHQNMIDNQKNIIEIVEAINYAKLDSNTDLSKEQTIFRKNDNIFVIEQESKKKNLIVCLEKTEIEWEMIQNCLSAAKKYFKKSASRFLTI